ncbi:PhzF family phenazine biosynthesis protein [Microbacterium sp. NPDC058389]|uniref:PhzF family phenazine biosynthesis protein n=1 Tax=Microbacterium sp. NPDC058389 TaxID=3346475 RepID=UPI0036461AE9
MHEEEATVVDKHFWWVDVFAETPLTGNPLSLVPDADDLDEGRMWAITREFNQSETTFLVTPTRPGADCRLRSFTVAGAEVLGAGHNAMGAWIWLAEAGRLDPARTEFAQQIGDDVLPVRIDRAENGRVQVSMRHARTRFVRTVHAGAEFADALGLDADALADGRSAEVVSTGAAHLLLALDSREDVDRADPDAAHLRRLLAEAGAEGCYVYSTADGHDGVHAYARFFNPTVGIVEDPATGTAAGPLAALLVREGLVPEHSPIRIEQGRALGRPSILQVVVDDDHVELSGSGIVVAEGVLHL